MDHLVYSSLEWIDVIGRFLPYGTVGGSHDIMTCQRALSEI